jgi:hypothetical protein
MSSCNWAGIWQVLTCPLHLSTGGCSESSEGLAQSAGLCLCRQHGMRADLRSGDGTSK